MILDEAGMVDHKRMDALTELIDRSGAKLVAVGDGKQLPVDRSGRHVRPYRSPRAHR